MIPNTEIRPDSFRRLPTNQKRRMRDIIEKASKSDIKDYLLELKNRTLINGCYFLLIAAGALLLAIAAAINSPLLFLLSALVFPVLNPLLGLAFSSAVPSVKHAGYSLLVMILTVLILFGAGWLAAAPGFVTDTSSLDLFAFLTQNNIVEWLLLILIAGLTAYWFTYQETLPRVSSIFLTLFILIPVFISGYKFRLEYSREWLSLLSLVGGRISFSLLGMFIGVWMTGFPPRKASGWLIFTAVIILSVLCAYELFFINVF